MRWDLLAADVGRRVHAKCPRWLFFVEGVGHCRDAHPSGTCARPSAGSHQNMDLKAGTWWGENLQAAAAVPVRILDAESEEASLPIRKTVYSPHTYGPSTHYQTQVCHSFWLLAFASF